MRRPMVFVGVLAWLALMAGPAAAHVELRLASPAPGETVTASLTEVRLEFSAALQPGAEHSIGLFGPDEVRVDDGLTTQPVQNVVVTAVGPLTAAGPYTVRYLVIGSDGHPIEGTYGFVYDGPLIVIEPSLEPSPEPSPEELDSPEPLAGEAEPGGGAPWLVIAAIAAAVLGAGAAVLSARRERRGSPRRTS